jgi:hypothetical protein
MKKLNINNAGRMPLWQKDLEFIQAGFTDPFEALVGELGMTEEYFIITGCSPYKPDSNHIAMGRGWFYYGGRILPVRPLPLTSVTSFTNPVVRLVPVTYADPAGTRDFISADQTVESVADVWRDDYLQPSVVERSAGFVGGVRLGVGAWTLRDIIANRNESPWTSGMSGLLEFKRIGRMVVLRGYAADVRSQPVAVDEGFPVPLGGLAMLHTNAGNEDFLIYINNQGELICKSTGGWGEPTLTGMTYMAETLYRATDPNTINDNIVTEV